MFKSLNAVKNEASKAKVVVDLLRRNGSSSSVLDSAERTWINKIDLVNAHIHRWS